jgi:hypothetical protein
MANASGRLGSYFPVSIAFTVWRDTLSRPAKSAWDHSRSARRTRRRFFITHQFVGDWFADDPSADHHFSDNQIVSNPWPAADSSVPPG